ncbi:twin arginine-targeting protein translocase TatB [Desulfocurvibacter africanus PCS]|uniref:Sec-independent protein translocase protein TatB homolog n=1 Tax=Desulfocurvibacter africanus PCS TaxID=1262666 RepID=M5Q1K8_DESAF|nr:Sec-independent protein translocase protein TatB [Desulfocurvibacter africanus]EMG37661.1 twin arginine-targeting protein translocase TatB [Desulfocurvibacter africanus PCS]
MFGIGTTELLIIILVALVVLGPSKLPEIMKTVGKGFAEFKRLSTDVKSTLDAEVSRAERDERRKEKELAEKKAKAREESAKKAEKDEASLGEQEGKAGQADLSKPVDDAAPTRPEAQSGPVVDVQSSGPVAETVSKTPTSADKDKPGGDKA